MNLPEISFATADPQQLEADVLSTVAEYLGRSLGRADPLRIYLRALEALLIQTRLIIDTTGKMNLLAYSTGDYLNHLGALVGCERLPATGAVTTVNITLSAPRATSTTINKGTRITAGDDIYFALDEAVIFLADEITKTAKATCTLPGVVGNGYAPGELNRIVDPQPFLADITNLTLSEGGADIEDDDNYRSRIHAAPESYSCAGSEGAYTYHALSTSPLISDVALDSETPGNVEVYVLLKGGELPGEEMLGAVYDKLNDKTVRPLTDNLTVLPPRIVEYDLNVRYWISLDDSAQAASIQSRAQAAVEEYIEWQRSKLGRDINPSELIYLLKAAGVKRVEVMSPIFKATDKRVVAIAVSKEIIFAGFEES